MTCSLSKTATYVAAKIMHDQQENSHVVVIKDPPSSCSDGRFETHSAEVVVTPGAELSTLTYTTHPVITVPDAAAIAEVHPYPWSGIIAVGLFAGMLLALIAYDIKRRIGLAREAREEEERQEQARAAKALREQRAHELELQKQKAAGPGMGGAVVSGQIIAAVSSISWKQAAAIAERDAMLEEARERQRAQTESDYRASRVRHHYPQPALVVAAPAPSMDPFAAAVLAQTLSRTEREVVVERVVEVRTPDPVYTAPESSPSVDVSSSSSYSSDSGSSYSSDSGSSYSSDFNSSY